MRRTLLAGASALALTASAAAQTPASRATLEGQVTSQIIDNPAGLVTPAEVRNILLNMLATLPTTLDVNALTPAPPAWGTNYGVYNGMSVDVGSFPLTTIYTGGIGSSVPLVPAGAALTGAILVPANDTGIFQQDGVAGYAGNESANPAVGVFGWGFVFGQTNLAQIWGSNTGFSNSPYFAAATQTGFNFNQGYGGEFDVNITKLPGGGTPSGTAFGLSIAGGSEIVPTGGAYALYINSYMRSGLYGWSAAIDIAASPNAFGIVIGPDATSGDSLSSQTLTFSGVNSSGGGVSSSLFVNSLGNLIAQGASGVEMQVLSGSIYQYSPNTSYVTNESTDNSGNSSLISSGNFVVNAGSAKAFSVQDASVTEFLVTSGSAYQYSPSAAKITSYSTDNSGNSSVVTSGNLLFNVGSSGAIAFQINSIVGFQINSGSFYQYSPDATKIVDYQIDNFGNSTITNGATGASFKFQDGSGAQIASLGFGGHGSASKYVCSDSSGNWFTQAGAC